VLFRSRGFASSFSPFGPIPVEISSAAAMRWLRCAAIFFSEVALQALGRNYWESDQGHDHRQVVGKCKAFECQAFHRPVQKSSEAYQLWAYDACPQKTFVDETGDKLAIMSDCCTVKYICLQTCGITVQHCYDQYWECVESTCAQKSAIDGITCVHDGAANDLQNMRLDVMGTRKYMTQAVNCNAFHENQREACDCVPSAEFDRRLQDRYDAFFRDYDPDRLNKKGTVKDKRHWKAFKGKRPEMFYRLYLQYRRKAVSIRNVTDGAQPPSTNESAEL